MSWLSCTVCGSDVPPGYTWCVQCNRGYESQLRCRTCGSMVDRGAAACPRCHAYVSQGAPDQILPLPQGVVRQFVPVVGLSSPLGTVAVPASASSVAAARVPERYLAGRHGVDAEVQIPQGDAELMTYMLRAASLLTELAARMNGFQGTSDMTRANIRACRQLALDLQEEVEVRRGPQGR